MAMKIHMEREAKNNDQPTTLFHSPVGALNSAKVCLKEALYNAFFSSNDSLRQSPFSFSRRA